MDITISDDAVSLSPSEVTLDIPIMKIRSMIISDICTLSRLHNIIMPNKYPAQFFKELPSLFI